MWRTARLIAAKDLSIEWRSRQVTNQVLPFAGLTLVLFAFALDRDDITQRVAPGLFWLATTFSLIVLVQRTFAVETADGALDTLRVAGVDPAGIYLGKSMALAAQLAVLEALLLLGVIVFYASSIKPAGIVLVVVTAVLVNAVNLLDGLDGLAAGVALIGGSAFFVYSYLLTRTINQFDYANLAKAIKLTPMDVDLTPVSVGAQASANKQKKQQKKQTNQKLSHAKSRCKQEIEKTNHQNC